MRADRLLVSILAIAATTGTGSRAQLAGADADGVPPAPRLRTVVVDPGHGGDDPGVTAASGLTEAEVVMDVARQLSRVFEEEVGTQRIVMTRSGDVNVPVASRISTANGSKGDVLVSIHVAGSSRPEVSGPRIYSMGTGLRIVELVERRLRPRARRLIQGQLDLEETDLRLTPWALAQDEFSVKSAALAGSIARQLRETTDTSAPVASLPLAILAGARMPAVLVELGSLSNSAEADKLKNGGYRHRLARAIFRGITSFAIPGALAERAAPEEPHGDE